MKTGTKRTGLIATAAVASTAAVLALTGTTGPTTPACANTAATGEPIVGKPGTSPAAAPAFQVTGPVACQRIYRITWPTLKGAVGYLLWVDGKKVDAVPQYEGATQSLVVPLACNPAGVKHTLNLQAQTGAVTFGPKRATAATLTAKCSS